MTQDEQICSLALTRIPGLGLTGAFRLVSSLGSATRVFEHRKELSQLVPGVSEKIITALNNSEAFRRAEQELTFCEKNHIRCLTLNDEGYPSRLRECDDAPLALFYRGNADLNTLHIINIVVALAFVPVLQLDDEHTVRRAAARTHAEAGNLVEVLYLRYVFQLFLHLSHNLGCFGEGASCRCIETHED